MIPIGLIILKRCCLIFEDSGVDQKQAEKLADPLGVECLAVPITVEEIKRTIGNLRLIKSPGPDVIVAEILKIISIRNYLSLQYYLTVSEQCHYCSNSQEWIQRQF